MDSPNRYRVRPMEQKMSKNESKTEGTIFLGVKIHFKEYCSKTSIHCFQYFGQNRTIFEIIWWIITFTIIFSLCGFTIFQIYQKWAQSPVIVSFATKETPIYRVPFPAVTICPTAKISHKCLKFSEVAAKKENNEVLTQLEEELFDYVSLLCVESQQYFYSFDDDQVINMYGNETLSEEFYKVLEKCNPFTPERFSVRWMGNYVKFENVFFPIITNEGICFTFNMVGRKDVYRDNVTHYHGFNTTKEKSYWISQVGYSGNAPLNTYPKRALLSGATNSLEVKIIHDTRDVDYRCGGAEQGYKLVLHIPNRIPIPKEEYVIVPFDRASSIVIYPEMITTSERIKTYKPMKRNCYFPEEKYLQFFKTYSRVNCQEECLTNFTLFYCGCVEYYMPREESTPICGVGSLVCVNEAQRAYKLSKLSYKLNLDKKLKGASQTKHSKPVPIVSDRLIEDMSYCNCLHMCTDTSYDAIVTPLVWNWKEQWSSFNETRDLFETAGVTQMNLFFKKNDITTTERNELYGPTDFLSNFGGLLGLFSGFSVLSLMEIIYFCSIRIMGNLKKFGRWYEVDEG